MFAQPFWMAYLLRRTTMEAIYKQSTLLKVLAVLVLAALLVTGNAGRARAQESQDEPAVVEDSPPAELEQTPPTEPEQSPPAEPEPAPPPSGVVGPDSGEPWWNWHRDQVPPVDQFLATIAYDEFWARRTTALAHPEFHPELVVDAVMAGASLNGELSFLRDLQAKGQAQVVRVERHPVLVYSDEDHLVIYDAYVDSSYLIDSRSQQPIGAGPNVEPHVVPMLYQIRKTFDSRFPGNPYWKVVDWRRVAN
jgi:hypothetical protein